MAPRQKTFICGRETSVPPLSSSPCISAGFRALHYASAIDLRHSEQRNNGTRGTCRLHACQSKYTVSPDNVILTLSDFVILYILSFSDNVILSISDDDILSISANGILSISDNSSLSISDNFHF